jgi:hypothetical protein
VLPSVHSVPAAVTEGFQLALTVGAAFAIVGALLALALVSGSGAEQDSGEVEAVPVTA